MLGSRPTWGMLVVVLFITAPGQLAAQPEQPAGGRRVNTAYLDNSIEAFTHLRTAASYVAEQSWSEAIDLYSKLIEEFGDRVVQVDSSPVYVSVRDYCHMQLARMPAHALAEYRKRVDAQAETWYRAGLAERDAQLLSRVVERTFCSSWGDNALDALAELAFEAGRFEEAYSLWKRIDTSSPDPRAAAGDPQQPVAPRLVYPDTELDPAWIEAKKILCHVFVGERAQAAGEIAQFRNRYPESRGRLGGLQGVLHECLGQIARETAAAAAVHDSNWPTFAGNMQRSRVLSQSVDIGSVQWTVALPQPSVARMVNARAIPTQAEDVLSYHPLVWRDWVLVCGREEVRAYDLQKGPAEGDRPAWPPFRLRDRQGFAPPVAPRNAIGIPQHTMTVDGHRLYVRLGNPETTVAMRRGAQPDSYLVCLDLAAEGKELWRIEPDEAEPDLAFEGSPAVANGNVYIGVTRGGAMTHAYVACYDAATGAKQWRQLICESSSLGMSYQGSITHNLVTLGAGMVFYNTHLGAVAALDQRTGRVRWITTYPRDEMAQFGRVGFAAREYGRELNPCVYHDGLVIAMPADSEGIYAFDAITGDLRWKTVEPPRLGQLLGVAHGNLICTGTQVLAIDVATGKRVWQWPEGPGLAGYGRGILAGDFVYFPTKTHIHILDQKSGTVARPPVALVEAHNHSPGNLIIGDGYLVVAQSKSLTVFCQYEVLIKRFRELIAQDPTRAEPHFRLARAAEATGDYELAVKHFRETVQLASAEMVEDREVKRVALGQLHSLLSQLGQKAQEAKDWVKAEGHYREAAETGASDQARLDALLRVAEMWKSAGDAARTLAVYQELLADEPLYPLGVQVDASRAVRADVELANRVESLLAEFGRELYEPFDEHADALFAEAERDGELAAVERLLRSHPNARIVPQALVYLAAQHRAQGQIIESSIFYKQLLVRPDLPAPLQLAAMHGLAQNHESQRSWHTARAWWQRMARNFADASMPTKPEQSVASFVAEHLSRPPYDEDGKSQGGALQLPLTRRWTRSWGEDSRVMVPEGTHPPGLGVVLLVSQPESLQFLLARTGESVWEIRLDGPARWGAFHEERLLVGTDTQLVCLQPAQGEMLWRQGLEPHDGSVEEPPFGQTQLPAHRPESARSSGASTVGTAEFRLSEDRLLVRDGSGRLLCLSADSGAILWSYTPTEGAILPRPFFSGHHVALRTRLPGRFVVLDGDGRRRFELAQPSEPWIYAPLAVDGHRLCIATDPRTLELMDLADGRPVWSFEATSADQPVQPIAGPSALLVLAGGSRLIRLNPETGRQLWSQSVSDEALPDSPNAWAVDEQCFYCITRQLNLRAFRLEDGQLVWQQSLVGPGEEWQVALVGGYAIAQPRQPHATEGLPVVLCRASDGRIVQRVLLHPRGKEALAHFTPQLAVIGSEREVWALGSDPVREPRPQHP